MKKLLCLLLLTTSLFAQDRKIKPGDAIEVVVYGHQELSRVVTVSPQGNIDFPFMQNLPVDGFTLDRLREIITAQLTRYLNAYPVITISFAKANTFYVSVLGMVKNPGVVQVLLYTTLQSAIGAAGGFLPGARMNEVALIRQENGVAVSTAYDIERFLLEGDLKINPVLADGDVILVTGNPLLSTVKVVGSVRSPGAFTMFIGATIFDMILQAGGPTDDADLSKIRFVTPSRKKTLEYKIDLQKTLASQDYYKLPMVKPGDIIFIPKKKNVWRSAFNTLRDVGTLSLAAYYISRIIAENK